MVAREPTDGATVFRSAPAAPEAISSGYRVERPFNSLLPNRSDSSPEPTRTIATDVSSSEILSHASQSNVPHT
jgi:hypothetical protein